LIEALKKGGLQRKIVILMLVVGVFPGIVGVTAVYFMGRRLVMQSVGPSMESTAAKTASEIDTILKIHLRQADLLARDATLLRLVKGSNERYLSTDVQGIRKKEEALWASGDKGFQKAVLENDAAVSLKRLVDQYPDEYCHHMVIDAKGMVVAASYPVPDVYYADENWFQEAMSGRPVVAGPHLCSAGRGFVNLHFAVPIVDKGGNNPVGVLYIERQREQIFSSFKNFRYGETGHLEVVDVFSRTYVMEALGAEKETVPGWLISDILEKKKGWSLGIDEHGNKAVKAFAPLTLIGWYAVVGQDVSEVYAPMKALMMGATIPGFFTVLVLAFIWFNLSRKMILRPISNLSEGASQIGHGNLDYRLDIKTGDELENLAHEFNTMAESLSASQEKLRRWNEELKEEVAKRTADLEETMEELKVSKEELQDSLDELEANREELEKRNEDLASANVRLREMDRLKSEFLANMSHELRTPLTAVIGFSELLIDRVMGDLNEEQAGCVENVLTSGQHLLKLINDILDLSKIEAGKMEIHMEGFQLSAIVDFVRKIVSPLIEKKGQVLNVDVADGMPDIYADPGKIKQLLLNLVGNAIKFTPDGGRVGIRAEFKDNYFVLSVSDTGIGIRPEDRERIFQEFQQAEGSTSREYGGTGLGLTLTKRLAEMHGGRIELESEVGRGSRFTVYLPLRIEKRPLLKEVEAAEKPEEAAVPPGRAEIQPLVLVVEDDPKLSRLLTVYLTQAGYRVETAMDGEEALRKAKELQPFAITLDIMLPKKDGWEVLQELKGMPETRDIPVTIVSMVEDKDIGFSLGAADYLVKPVSREGLLGSLEKYSFTTKVAKERMRVLVVDDDPRIVEYLASILRRAGFQVTAATGGEEGLRIALEELPDLIILDLMMPKVSGFDVIRELKRHPSGRGIPVFVLTAKDLSREEKNTLLADVARVFQKGEVAKEELVEAIRRMEVIYPERAGLVDSVTGLLNRRYFLNRLPHEIGRSQRYGREFSVSLIDIDSFGHYNEVNGCLQGDIVLREIARLLGKNLRKADIAVRYNGGKFAVIFPETARDAALLVSDKLRSLIEGYPFPKRESQPSGKLTVSVSVASFPADGEASEQLVGGLERGVSDAKRAGGNRVVEVGRG
jgi:diguanylate cyclase (GGDEF)-like protein